MPASVASSVSETDVRVFAELINPSKTNLDRLRDEVNHAANERTETIHEEESDESEDEPPRSPSPPKSPPASPSPPASDEDRSNDGSDSDGRDGSDDGGRDDDDDGGRSRASHASGRSHVSDASGRSHRSLPPRDDRDSDSDADERSLGPRGSGASSLSRPASVVSAASQSSVHQARQELKASPFLERMSAIDETPPYRPSAAAGAAAGDDDDDVLLEKQQVLLDMERMKMQGISMSKEWSVRDRLEDMQFEMRRHSLHIEQANNVSMMKDALRLACSGVEVLSKRFNLLELDGWSSDVCRDMSKYDHSLSRLYRKYWKRGYSNSPEMELAMALVGSMAMFHFKQKLRKNMVPPPAMGRPAAPRRAAPESDSDEEGPP